MSKQFRAMVPVLPYLASKKVRGEKKGKMKSAGSMTYSSEHKDTNFVTAD